MNRAAAGLGSWLLREAARPVSLESALLDSLSFTLWQARQGGEEPAAAREALLELLRALWHEELTPEERAVLCALHLEGKTAAVYARELGVHHSTVARVRHRAEEKLRAPLGYAMRYQAFVDQRKGAD